jgi:hypothetical protein
MVMTNKSEIYLSIAYIRNKNLGQQSCEKLRIFEINKNLVPRIVN